MLLSQAITDLQNLTKRKISYEQVATVLGVSKQAIGNRVARESKLQDYEWQKLKDHFISVSDNNLESIKNDLIAKRMDYLENKGEIEVDYYPEVFGSCGSGTFVFSEHKEKMPVARKLFTAYSPTKHYSIINAFGDSMNPYIHDKDKLLVQHWDGEQIKDNRVYVFRYGEKIFCKRLVDNIKHIIAKSDNTMYEPIKIDCSEDDFQIIGQIVGLIRNME